MKPIRILLAEDQTLMRQGLKTLLETEPGIRVIGEAEDGKAAVSLAILAKPDIILMDVQMPQLNGVGSTAAICRSWPEARVIILTTFDRDDYVFQGVRVGAVGYLLKDLPAETLKAFSLSFPISRGASLLARFGLKDFLKPLATH